LKLNPAGGIDVADSAEFSGYDFKNYYLDLYNDDSHIGQLTLGRDEAVKLALTVIALQHHAGHGLTCEEGKRLAQYAAAR
jgi:hypothetical protein